jgi:hypothetical protein
MYTHLLGSALDERDRCRIGASPGEILADLSWCRTLLRHTGPQSVAAGRFEEVTTSLDYDVALIVLARALDVEFDVDRFDNGERHLLEAALAGQGIGTGGADDPTGVDRDPGDSRSVRTSSSRPGTIILGGP